MGFGKVGFEIDHDATVVQANAGNIVFTNSMFDDNSTRGNGANFSVGSNVTSNFAVDAFMMADEKMNREDVDPMLRDPYNLIAPDYRPTSALWSRAATTCGRSVSRNSR